MHVDVQLSSAVRHRQVVVKSWYQRSTSSMRNSALYVPSNMQHFSGLQKCFFCVPFIVKTFFFWKPLCPFVQLSVPTQNNDTHHESFAPFAVFYLKRLV